MEPAGLNIRGTCGKPLDSGSGRFPDAGEGSFEGMGGLEPGVHEGRAVWRAKPKIERAALDIGGTCGKLPTDGSGAFWDAGEAPLEGLGAWGPICTGGGCKLL
jgi:hypothetical protein